MLFAKRSGNRHASEYMGARVVMVGHHKAIYVG